MRATNLLTTLVLISLSLAFVPQVSATGTSCGIGAGYTNIGQCSFWCEAGEHVHVYAINSGVASGGFATCPGGASVACESIGVCERARSQANPSSGWGTCTAGIGAVQVQCWSR